MITRLKELLTPPRPVLFELDYKALYYPFYALTPTDVPDDPSSWRLLWKPLKGYTYNYFRFPVEPDTKLYRAEIHKLVSGENFSLRRCLFSIRLYRYEYWFWIRYDYYVDKQGPGSVKVAIPRK